MQLNCFTLSQLLGYNHSHKKRKDSLETLAELVILPTYIENQAVLEPSVLYRGSKCKQTKQQGSQGLLSACFSSLCQDANKARSKCAIIACNLSKKHKLTLYKTQNREPNYVDHKFFCSFYQELPACTEPWGETSKYYSWLVGWCMYCVTLRLHDIKKLTSVSL